ncbi:hypothetical protein [Azospirillum thermophilum]|uniref:Uncharacterized protein n=1 Tax=Azospirillum thermophilum TaxID=2202148 RepID=A0A2S2CT66_9PROT|nr:hypothetical protein [Azospirillum thermophilum]AWK87692.1 hypothetical protein DEW08_17080 [Azospirillum thermophilum]
MLHIKDIEAFAHINEALAANDPETDDAQGKTPEGAHRPAAHPALMMALVATGRLPASALGAELPGALWGGMFRPRG